MAATEERDFGRWGGFGWLRVLVVGDEVALQVGLGWLSAVCTVRKLVGGAVAAEHAGGRVGENAVAAAEELSFGGWGGFGWLRVLFVGGEVALQVGRWLSAVYTVRKLTGGAVATAEELGFGGRDGCAWSVGGGCCRCLSAWFELLGRFKHVIMGERTEIVRHLSV